MELLNGIELAGKKQGAGFCVPDKSNAVIKHDFDAELYKQRNIVERFFQRIKEFRHISSRFDKLEFHFSCRFYSLSLIYQHTLNGQVSQQVTYRCNEHCKHCYVFDEEKSMDYELSVEQYIQLFTDLKKLGTLHITFTGGDSSQRVDSSCLDKF